MPHRGDIVGCTVHFEDKTDLCVPVSFTLNGREIRRCSMKHFGRNLYPCIGMAFGGISVQFTVSALHFGFLPMPHAYRLRPSSEKCSVGARFTHLHLLHLQCHFCCDFGEETPPQPTPHGYFAMEGCSDEIPESWRKWKRQGAFK